MGGTAVEIAGVVACGGGASFVKNGVLGNDCHLLITQMRTHSACYTWLSKLVTQSHDGWPGGWRQLRRTRAAPARLSMLVPRLSSTANTPASNSPGLHRHQQDKTHSTAAVRL
jgi:hypothetical protein